MGLLSILRYVWDSCPYQGVCGLSVGTKVYVGSLSIPRYTYMGFPSILRYMWVSS